MGDLDVSLETRNLFSQRHVLSSAETVVSWHGSEEATTNGKEDACNPSLLSEEISTMGNSLWRTHCSSLALPASNDV